MSFIAKKPALAIGLGALTGGLTSAYIYGSTAAVGTGAVVGAGVGAAGSAGGRALTKGLAGGIGSTLIEPPSPIITTAGFAGQAEKDRRRRRGGYGSTILAGGALGVASTRKQVLG